MAWHLAPALEQLRAEVNKKWPNRSKASDGTIGDASHSARTSDHNPNSRGSVNAMDITVSGIDKGTLIAVAKRHPSVRYIISDRKIMNRDIGNFRARAYSGSNPHTKHVHISLYQSATAENRRQSWGLADAKPVSGVGGGGGSSYESATAKHSVGSRVMRLHSGGTDVKWLQKRLYKIGYTITPKSNGDFDALFGPEMEKAVKALQTAAKITVDGDAGEDTIKAAKAAKVVRQLPKVTKPKAPAKKVYAFPFSEPGAYIGPKDGPDRSHSGLSGRKSKGVKDSTWIKRFVNALIERGWNAKKGGTYLTRFGNDGGYGAELEALIRAFQKDQGLPVDGLAGKTTWDAAFNNPIT